METSCAYGQFAWHSGNLGFVTKSESLRSARDDIAREWAMSLHLDVFPQISRDIEVFAFDDCRLAFFKAPTCHRLKLQNFLFRRRRLFGWCFFFLARNRLLLRRTYERGWFAWHECRRRRRFGRDRFFQRNTFFGRRGFHRSWFRFEINLWRGRLVVLLGRPMRGHAAQGCRASRLRDHILLRSERTDNGHAQPVP